MKKWKIALGFYQEYSVVESVVAQLKKNHFSRFVTIQRGHDQKLTVCHHKPFLSYFIPIMLALVGFFLIVSKYLGLIPFSWPTVVVGTSTFFILAIVHSVRSFVSSIRSDVIEDYKKHVLIDEILVLVQVYQTDMREVLAILRNVKTELPSTFILRQDILEEGSLEISSEVLTSELLSEKAKALSYDLCKTEKNLGTAPSLIRQIQKSTEMFLFLRRDISDAEYIQQTIPLSAEWMLDNMYVLEGSIEDIKRNLPNKYYKKLPKIATGPLVGLPRVYALAVELVKGAAGGLNRENIINFLESYQLNSPLNIGELWAFPLMLRLRLVEWIEFLAIRVDNRMREGELASFWGNRILHISRHEPEKLEDFLKDIFNVQASLTGHFAEELLGHLFDEEMILPMVKNLLEDRFELPLDDVLHQEHMDEMTEQVVFANAIKSLITLSQLPWQDIFESVCPVDAVFRQDPDGAYALMDFNTRNSYRNVVEQMACRLNISEVEVAKKALQLADQGTTDFQKHIGYYLIDDGRSSLEREIGYKPTIHQRVNRWVFNRSEFVYLGGFFLILVTLEAVAINWIVHSHLTLTSSVIFFFFSLLLISEIAVQAVNILLTLILPTDALPKMSFKKGLPLDYKTLVVVPMMLVKEASIREEIDRLEIRYLANTDPQLYYGLFSDDIDAKEQHMPEDAFLLSVALNGINTLEKKYGAGKFFLFHRQRVWSDSENAWIGMERKRGKLEYLNRFLMGEPLPENIVFCGNAEILKGTRFVITLDSDTQLPKDQARALVEVLTHPLNRAYLSPLKNKLERGYTIIQPRVGTDFVRAKATWFSRIFSDPTVVDPYTLAVSNVYQDLEGEGSFHGKGIYDVAAFHALLSKKFPDEHLLSHDLIEGSYVRVGFAGHIFLLDSHPTDYCTWEKRQHRWIRGDWQIIDWLFSKVPTSTKKESNSLSWLNRWKIFDNLRRSLVPCSLVGLLIASWTMSSVPAVYTGLATFVLFLPTVSFCINKCFDCSFASIGSSLAQLKTLFIRLLIITALLPYEAYISFDAIIRVAYRRLISHQNLLQWTSSENVSFGKQDHWLFVLKLSLVSFFSIGVFTAVYWENPSSLVFAAPFCLLWLIAPWIIHAIDKPLKTDVLQHISASDQKKLRKIGRKTWRYFDELVGPQTHWMPPDNYQTDLNVEIAQRTSPTNIGMWLTSLISACDFKYIHSDMLIERSLSTIRELKKLERFEGHFLNWYNIQNLEPLLPRYVSTVDSGNLLASLWTLKQALLEVSKERIIPLNPLSGIRDTYEVFKETYGKSINISFSDSFDGLPHFTSTIKNRIKIIESLFLDSVDDYWLKKVGEELHAWLTLSSRYLSWVEVLTFPSIAFFQSIDPQALHWRDLALNEIPSLQDLASQEFSCSLRSLIESTKREGQPGDIKAWGKRLEDSLGTAYWFAGEKIGQIQEIVREIDVLTEEMNLKFLYNTDRELFVIGYNVDDKRLDPSFYDLLASEARIASLVAIAKEDAPLHHWWSLGRPYSTVQGRRVLLSWGGTMFEYLMPLIFNKQYEDSLIGEACHAAVEAQIGYGKKRGIPWGISESAFSALDAHKIYQYRSFGVPGLGLKRETEEDLVVSPYSSALALSVNAPAAIKNLNAMAESHSQRLMGPYGFYDAIDYTRQRNPKGERGVVVSVYMAHHQGMIFSTINNILNKDALIERFRRDPRVSGIESILYERIPYSVAKKYTGIRKEPPHRQLEPFSPAPIMGIVETPQSVTPKIHLLSNGGYSLMITTTGGGYSRWRDFEIYRWRADTTTDSWGSFCYIKDMHSKNVWATTYQPTQNCSQEYLVSFKEDKAEFRRKDDLIEAVTEVVVSPDDNAEIRLVTLANHSNETRHIELTSYLELVLAPHLTDRAHPSFNKLFIETEALPEESALFAFRRLRSPEDQPLWALHILASEQRLTENIQYETDRARFVGRGKSLKNPQAMNGDLSNTAGTILDPIFSLRQRVLMKPGQRIEFSFVTAVADSREAAMLLVDKYKDIAASRRAIGLAWTYAQLELRQLRIHQEEVQLFQKLASRLIYPHSQLRSMQDRLRKNQLGQSGLWPQGISGDLPIVSVVIGDMYNVDIVKQLLIAHAFWGLRGLKVDLVILNEEEVDYWQPLQEHLQSLVEAYSYRAQINTSGGVFLKNTHYLKPEELNLIYCVSGAVLVAARGSLRQQLVSPKRKKSLPGKLIIKDKIGESPSRPLPFMELLYFNGLGGFTLDGHAYVIYLDSGSNTPAPWINVLANPKFGTMASEAGMGCTWYGNSQTNRLTPWSNDPLLDPITDTIYIRDDELGVKWTPTPAPMRELDPYRITHGQGYTRYEHNSHGIEQELSVFVPINDEGGLSLRIQRLRLYNQSDRKRRLSLYAYTEWVLGGNKEETQTQIVTEWDSESQALFAYNHYNPDFGGYVAFVFSTMPINTLTGDRTEFIGRNRSVGSPEALERKNLSGNTGATLDPCCALQVLVEIEKNSRAEVCFIMGYAPNIVTAREMIAHVRQEKTIDSLFTDTLAWWDKTLGAIQVEVPDMVTNFFVNRWLVYQSLSCRFWGRTAFYQSSGAYGFRDQLQDVMAFLYTAPHIAREYILEVAKRQFVEGDVQHWWHPQSGAGIRTRCSDDLLWLPFVTAQYVRVTEDASILEETIPFLEGEKLTDDQEEVYQTPTVSEETGTLLEHCRRAIHKGTTAGVHGLPLIGSCDWNDGMNRIGVNGKGESVWLGWFLTHVMDDFAYLLSVSTGDNTVGKGFEKEAIRLAEVIENTAWDGAWYRRAYFDDGTPLGSKKNKEGRIDSLAQSWSVISGHADVERSKIALRSAEENLVKTDHNIVLLLTPPFDKTPLNPGYIKGYPPGVRENGGQYTHGSSWMALAFARLGEGNKAVNLLKMMSPTLHTETPEDNALYKIEPYVLAGDIYDLPGQEGRGGWSWYTGSASWIYRIWVEEVLGFTLRGDKLTFNCSIPREWDEFKLHYRYKSSIYHVVVKNPSHLSKGNSKVTLDGVFLKGSEILLLDDDAHHNIEIVLSE